MTGPVSVVIPTHNSAAFIGETLVSVFAQTLPPREIIVADDASTDDTVATVSALARAAPVPVRLLRQPRNSGGPARPLNDGITAATGSLIATVDHDDLMLPDRLEMQMRCFDKGPDLGIVIGRCRGVQAGENGADPVAGLQRDIDQLPRRALGDACYRITAGDAYNGLVAGNYALTCSAFLFPKSVWHECGGFPESIRTACDLAFLQRVLRTHDLGFMDRPVVRWRMREGSLYKASNGVRRMEELLAIHGWFERELLTPSARQALDRRVQQDQLGLAYFRRQEGKYRRALMSYLAACRRGGWNRHAILGLLKLLPHWLLRGAGRVQGV